MILENNKRSKLFTFTKKSMHIFIERYKSIQAPRGWRGTGTPYVKGETLKIADYIFLVKFCSSWIFQGLLPNAQYRCVQQLLGILKVLLGWKVVADDVDWLEQTIWEDLAETSLVLPASTRVLWWHYLGHYGQQIRDWGSPMSQSTARMERRIAAASESTHNRLHPELNIALRYQRTHPTHPEWDTAERELRAGVLGTELAEYVAPEVSGSGTFFNVACGIPGRIKTAGGREFRTTATTRRNVTLFLQQKRHLFDPWKAISKLTNFHQAVVQSQTMSCADAEKSGRTCASYFETVSDIGTRFPELRIAAATRIVGRVLRYVRVLLETETFPRWEEVAEVHLFQWSTATEEGKFNEPEHCIDFNKNKYNLTVIPVRDIHHMVLVVRSPNNRDSQKRYYVLPCDLDAAGYSHMED